MSKIHDREINILKGASYFFAFLGLGILLLLLFLVDFDKIWTDSIVFEKVAQIGDFIGGLIGSLWAFTGVLLFYVALKLQRKEFSLQREELSSQRLEFRINRITNIIFHQIDRVESQLKESEFFIDDVHPTTGLRGMYLLNNKLGETSFHLKNKSYGINLDQALNYLEINKEPFSELFDLLSNSYKVVNKVITNSIELNESEKQELKYIFTQNIGEEALNMVTNINLIVNEYFIQAEVGNRQDLNPLSENEVVYHKLMEITSQLITQVEEYG